MSSDSTPRTAADEIHAIWESTFDRMKAMQMTESHADLLEYAWAEGYKHGLAASPAASGDGLRVVRQIRGRLFEAAWRSGEREWLDPKATSRILDEVEAALAATPPLPEGLDVTPGYYATDEEINEWRRAHGQWVEGDRDRSRDNVAQARSGHGAGMGSGGIGGERAGARTQVETQEAPPLTKEALADALHGARNGTCAMPDGGLDDWDCIGVAKDVLARLASREGAE